MTNTSHKAISTNKAPTPVGPYNQAISAGGWLYCSGQIALDPSTNQMVGQDDIQAETKQVLSNLIEVLKAGGANPSQVIRTTIYLIDLKDFEKVNSIYSDFFSQGISPARACVQVARLPKDGRVEIDCVAWIG